MSDPSFFSQIWTAFDRAGPLANFLQIAGAALATGGLAFGLLRRRLRRADDRIALLERDVATREARIDELAGERDRLASERAALSARLPPCADPAGDDRTDLARCAEWIANARDVADVLARRADFIARHATGERRAPALAMVKALCDAARLFGPPRPDVARLGADAEATLELEGRPALSLASIQATFDELNLAHEFDAAGVEGALRATSLASQAMRAGRYALAAPLARNARRALVAHLGEDALQAVEATLLEASLDLHLGLAQHAHAAASRLAQRLRAAPAYGPRHRMTIMAGFLESLTLHALDRMQDALDVARDIADHAVASGVVSPADPDVVAVRRHLVQCLSATGAHDEAIALARRLSEEATAAFGSGHVATIDAQMQLGDALMAANELAEAEPVLRSAVARLSDDRRPTAIAARQALATCLVRLKRPEEAVAIALRAKQQASEIGIGRDAPLADHIDATLAAGLAQSGHADEALRLAATVVARRTACSSRGPQHRATLAACCLYAECLAAAGRDAEALATIDNLIAQGASAPIELRFVEAEALGDALRAKLGLTAAPARKDVADASEVP